MRDLYRFELNDLIAELRVVCLQLCDQFLRFVELPLRQRQLDFFNH